MSELLVLKTLVTIVSVLTIVSCAGAFILVRRGRPARPYPSSEEIEVFNRTDEVGPVFETTIEQFAVAISATAFFIVLSIWKSQDLGGLIFRFTLMIILTFPPALGAVASSNRQTAAFCVGFLTIFTLLAAAMV